MIEIIKVNKIFNENKANQKNALCNLSLVIEDGEYVAIMGKSGAGKTTLLRIMGCMDVPTSGEYILNGSRVAATDDKTLSRLRNRSLGMVTQNAFLVEELSAIDNVSIPVALNEKKKRKILEISGAALTQVGLQQQFRQRVSTLSGGEKQRVAIARALVNNPQIILADEPTGALDTANADAVMKIFEDINAQGKTVIIITHDHDVAARCKRIITLSDGRVLSDTTN